MPTVDAEIGIVGAGPAGARAAELLAGAGADVHLWDPKAPWEKPCGGGLPASAFLHVPELKEVVSRARRIDVGRAETPSGVGFDVRLARPLHMIARRDLAAWQLERATAAGARHVPAAIRSVERAPGPRAAGGWRLEDRDGGVHRVRLLVGADGAASLVRRCASPGLRVELLPTRVAYPDGPGPTPDTALFRFYERVQGYLWDFPRVDHRSMGVVLEPGTWNRPRMDDEVEAYRRSVDGDGEGEPPRRAGAVIGTAWLGHGDYSSVGDAGFALLGDAAGFADPATGEGIENALRSGAALAAAYRADGDFRSYPARIRSELEAEFRAARILRRVLLDHGAAVRLVRRGARQAWARAVVAALADAVNERDASLIGLLRRALRGPRRARRPRRG